MRAPGRQPRHDAPRAPWGAFPLSELLVLAAAALAAVGALSWGGERATWAVLAAMALGCLAGLEVAAREHFAGRRPHGALLAGAAAAIVGTVAFVLRAAPGLAAALAVTVFGAGVFMLHRAYLKRVGSLRAGRDAR